jgi:hypothetical protein
MLEYQPNIVLSEQDYDIVGKRPIRPDGIAKVTGRATYGADIRLPGMLYGRSCAAHMPMPGFGPSTRAMPKNSRVCTR